MTRYLVALVLLLISVAAGRSDEHRDTRRNRPTATPTVYALATVTPLPLQPAADSAPQTGAGIGEAVCAPARRGDCQTAPILGLPAGEVPPAETPPPGAYP
jgi:hypothetical protein